MNPQRPYGDHGFVCERQRRSTLSRREWLARSAGVLGLWAAGGWPSLLRAEEVPQPANLPRRAGLAPSRPVAIQRCLSYEPAVVREKMDAALGGIGHLVRDKTVTVKVNMFVSVGKMKDHAVGGVTLSCKNVFGITPTALYGDDAPNEESVEARVGPLHENRRPLPAGVPAQLGANPPNGATARVPRIVADLLGARPVDLAIIDGVNTITGGEGPWIEHVQALQPKLLFAGRNPVCTDAVCAAAMGYDVTVGSGQFPFPGENHLRWAAEAGLGTNDAKRIEVAGLSLAEARCKFRIPPATPGKADARFAPASPQRQAMGIGAATRGWSA